MKSIEIRIEKIKDVLSEIKPITEKLAKTNGITGKETNPNMEKYINHNESGLGVLFTLRVKRSLEGYIYYFLGEYAEAKGMRMATMDSMYVKEEFRGIESLMLIQQSEEILKKIGADLIFLHHKTKDELGPLYEKLGYKPINIEYVKTL